MKADGIEIIYYTDPLCCWSWVMEPEWNEFLATFGDSVNVVYKMAGLLPSWSNFNDSVNSIRKPVQMGPEWLHAKELSGVQIDTRIWHTDPPASSFPGCIAVKCAQLQSKEAGASYLYLLREAVMLKNENIARTEVLIAAAFGLSERDSSFDVERFRTDLFGQAAKDAFRRDWQEVKYRGIVRLPALIFRSKGGNAVMLKGYQTFESLKEAMGRVGYSK